MFFGVCPASPPCTRMMKKSAYTEKASTYPEAPDFDLTLDWLLLIPKQPKVTGNFFYFLWEPGHYATCNGLSLREGKELSPQSRFEGVGVRRNTVIFCLYPENSAFCEPVPLSSQSMTELRSGGLVPGHPTLAVTFSQDFQIPSGPRHSVWSRRGRSIYSADCARLGAAKPGS